MENEKHLQKKIALPLLTPCFRFLKPKKRRGGRVDAEFLLDTLLSTEKLISMAQTLVNANLIGDEIRRNMARLGALAKIASDPKQAEKSFIYECWQVWQKTPEIYASKAAFGRDMLTKCDHLKSQKMIEDWCRDWAKP